MSNKIGIALTKNLCPLCGAKMEDDILINSKLTEKAAKAIEKLNGEAVAIADYPCNECSEFMEKGFLLIGYIDDKSGKKNEDLYRSGNKWIITHEAAKEIFPATNLKHGFAFIDVKVAMKVGLPDVNLNA